jgi:hypothetical protein
MLILAGIIIMYAAYFPFSLITIDNGFEFYPRFLLNFWDGFTVFAIILPVALFLIFTKNGRIIWNYMHSSLDKNHQFSKTELQSIVTATRASGKFALGTGVFCLLGSFIMILANFNYAEQFAMNVLLRNLGVAFLTPLYTIAIAFFIFYPLQVWAENKLRELTKDD